MGIEWTKEQKRAISYKQNRELLISAAAGAGKTTVMVERVLQACFSRGISPEKFIILTYTDKAAANMKKKLEVELAKKVRTAEDPADKARWRAIQKELPLAQVSTIHSFCLRLIKEYKHLLLDREGELYYPQDLRTIDKYESEILQEEALDGLIGEIYSYFLSPETRKAVEAREWPALFLDEGITEEEWFADFLAMQRLRDKQKDDRGFREDIKKSYSFLRSLPNYEAWCREAFSRLIEEEQDFPGSPACQYFLEELEGYLVNAEKAFFSLENHPYRDEIYKPEKNKSKEKERFIDLYPKLKDFVAAYRTQRPAGSPIDALSPEDRSAIWDACAEFNRNFPQWLLFQNRGENIEKAEFRELFGSRLGPLLQFLQGSYGETTYSEFGIKQIKSPFLLTIEEIKAYSARMFPLLARFLEVLFLFDRRYLALKREKNVLDFSDYEHLALEIVHLPGVSDILSRTYREIIVDEYQDTSPLQEALMQALQTDRITMLGDIKQSIYLFRHANPNIFNNKLKRFVDSTYADPSGVSREGETILLNKNFRSRASLLDFINNFFASFLREETGEIDYDESQRLIAGLPEEAFPQVRATVTPCSFVYCFEEKDRPQKADFSAAQTALLSAVAKLLAQGFLPEEIAILARTRALASEAQEALEKQGIPTQLNMEKEFLNSTELRLLKALVELLANFAQDLPLVAILRSELGGQAFTETELFQVASFSLEGERLAHFYEEEEEETRRSFFYERFLAYAKTGPDEALREKAAAFLETYAKWRKQATFLSLHDLLRRIIEESSWLDSLSGQFRGAERLADVEKFLETADRYGKNNPQDFSGFSCYLEEIQKHKVEFKDEDDGQISAGVVNVMTMHGSKGLEFPAVIYYEASYQKKAESLTDPRIFSVEEGLAANYPDESYDLLAPRRLYFQVARDFRNKAENYRLLYVAMTRAKEALCITGSPGKRGSGSEKRLEELETLASKARASEEGGRFDSRFLADLKSDFDLLFAFLSLNFPDLLHIEEEAKKAEGLCLEKGACSLCFKELSAMEADFQEAYSRYLAAGQEKTAGPEDSEGLKEEGLPDFREPRELLAVDEKETNRSSEATILLADAFAFPESKEAKESLRTLLQDRLPGDEKLFIPGKVTVSELKGRLMKDGGHDGGDLPEPLMEMALSLREIPEEDSGQEDLSPTEYGTFLHRLFERLDVASYFNQAGDCQEEAAARSIYEARVRESVAERVFAPEEEARAKEAFPLVYSFLQSSLAKKLFLAERKGAFVGRELPFTLAVPAIGLADPGEEISLVQGMIDLFFDSDEGTILVDYKSDRLHGTKEEREACLLRRYQVQMDYYALAIERLRGRQVTESYIWLIREGRAVRMPKTEIRFTLNA